MRHTVGSVHPGQLLICSPILPPRIGGYLVLCVDGADFIRDNLSGNS